MTRNAKCVWSVKTTARAVAITTGSPTCAPGLLDRPAGLNARPPYQYGRRTRESHSRIVLVWVAGARGLR